jgi:hypothetical protein
MPRREKDRALARRRKRKNERKKLRAKGLLPPHKPKEAVKAEGKKSEKTPGKEALKTAGESSTTEG